MSIDRTVTVGLSNGSNIDLLLDTNQIGRLENCIEYGHVFEFESVGVRYMLNPKHIMMVLIESPLPNKTPKSLTELLDRVIE